MTLTFLTALFAAAEGISISLVGIVVGLIVAAIVYFILDYFVDNRIAGLVAVLIFLVCAFDVAGID